MPTPDAPPEIPGPPRADAAAPILLALLVVCHVVQAGWVIAVDRTWPYLMTHQLHMGARELHHALHAPGFRWLVRGLAGEGPLVEASAPWPPLTALCTHFASVAVGELSRYSAAWGAVPWTAVLLLATYRLGRQLAGPRTGLLAALVVGSYPMVLGHRTMAMPFLPLAAQIAALAGAVRNLEARPSARTRLEVGAWAGLALLTRLEASAHIAVVVATSLLACPAARLRLVKNLAWAAGVALVVGGWWLLPSAWRSLRFYLSVGLLERQVANDKVELLSLINLFYYPARLVQVQLGLPMAALAVGSLVWAVRRRVEGIRPLVVWVVALWVFYVFVPMKGGRYTLPLLVPLAVCTAVVARELARRGARGVEGALAVLALVQWIALVHAPAAESVYPASGHRPERWGTTAELWEDAVDVGRLQPWTSPDWDQAIERLALAIDRYAAQRGLDTPTVGIADEVAGYVNPLLEIRRLQGADFERYLRYQVPPPYAERVARHAAKLAEVDLLIVPQDYAPSANDERSQIKSEAMARASSGRPTVASVRLPDGGRAILLGR